MSNTIPAPRTAPPAAAPTGFLNGPLPGAPAGAAPIPIGSIASSEAVRQPGAGLSINDFGLDVHECTWTCRTAVAATLKPDWYDANPYVANLYCTESNTVEGEGLMSTIRATYKGLISGTPRPSQPTMTTDTNPQTLTFQNGISAVGGGSYAGGGSEASSAVNYITYPNIPVPEPVYGLRGSSTDVPDMTALGGYNPKPPGSPAVAPSFIYYAYGKATYLTPNVLVATLVFKPADAGWLCDRLEYTREGYCYCITQQWRLVYIISDYIYPAVVDGFGRADSTSTLGDALTGQPWITGIEGSTTTESTWGISGFLAYSVTDSAGVYSEAYIDSTRSDCTIIVKLATVGTHAGVLFRLSDANNHFIVDGIAGTVGKFNGGTYTQIGTLSTPFASGDLMTVILSGPSIIVQHNGTAVGTFTDAFNQTATRHGMFTLADNVTRFGSFSAS